MTSHQHDTPIETGEWNPDDWDAARLDDLTPPAPAPAQPETAPEPPQSAVAASERSGTTDPVILGYDLSGSPEALAYMRATPITTVASAFTLANILHANKMVREASGIYEHAIRLHSSSPHEYPTVQDILLRRLICLLKSGLPLPAEDLERLRILNLPFANFIDGLTLSWRTGRHADALAQIGTAYDEFQIGEEPDALTLEIARRIEPSPFLPSLENDDGAIPSVISFYEADTALQRPDLAALARNLGMGDFDLQVFNREKALLWLYSNFGAEARNLFASIQDPAEASEYLGLHVVQLLGGWWIDPRLEVTHTEGASSLATQPAGSAFFLNDFNAIDSGFYGAHAGSGILEDAILSTYRARYLSQASRQWTLPGSGALTRALNRVVHRSLTGTVPLESKTLILTAAERAAMTGLQAGF